MFPAIPALGAGMLVRRLLLATLLSALIPANAAFASTPIRFAAPVRYVTGQKPIDVAVGGRTGDGAFRRGKGLAALNQGGHQSSLGAADLHRDGHMDLFSADTGDSWNDVLVYLAKPDGTLNPPATYAMPVMPFNNVGYLEGLIS